MSVKAKGEYKALSHSFTNMRVCEIAHWVLTPATAEGAGDIIRALHAFHVMRMSYVDYVDCWVHGSWVHGSRGFGKLVESQPWSWASYDEPDGTDEPGEADGVDGADEGLKHRMP
jgi:hypothetical protein